MQVHTALGATFLDHAVVWSAERLRVRRTLLWGLVKARRFAAHPLAWNTRRRLAESLAEGSYFRLVDASAGLAQFSAGTFPGGGPATAAAQAILARWDANPDEHPFWSDAADTRPHTFNIMTEDDLRHYPEILDFALSRPVIEAVAGYLGQIPRLRQMGVHVTPVDMNADRGAQNLHRDAADQRSGKVRIFINLDDVVAETGPFTVVPLDVTRRILSECRDRKPTEDDVRRIGGTEALIALTGPAGSGMFVDTHRCLHFGGRTRRGRRAVLMFHYTAVPDARVGKPQYEHPKHGRYDLAHRVAASDRYQRLVLDQRR